MSFYIIPSDVFVWVPPIRYMTMQEFMKTPRPLFHEPTVDFMEAFCLFQSGLTNLLRRNLETSSKSSACASCIEAITILAEQVKDIQLHALKKISKGSWIFTEPEVWQQEINEVIPESERTSLEEAVRKFVDAVYAVVHSVDEETRVGSFKPVELRAGELFDSSAWTLSCSSDRRSSTASVPKEQLAGVIFAATTITPIAGRRRGARLFLAAAVPPFCGAAPALRIRVASTSPVAGSPPASISPEASDSPLPGAVPEFV